MEMNIGNKIRELRKKKGITQEQLASALGITSQAVSKWEMSTGYPDIAMRIPGCHHCNHTKASDSTLPFG